MKSRGTKYEKEARDCLRSLGWRCWRVAAETGISKVTKEDLVAWAPEVEPHPDWPDGVDPSMFEIQVKYGKSQPIGRIYQVHEKISGAPEAPKPPRGVKLGSPKFDPLNFERGEECVVWENHGVVTGSLPALHSSRLGETKVGGRTEGVLSGRVEEICGRGCVFLARKPNKPWVFCAKIQDDLGETCVLRPDCFPVFGEEGWRWFGEGKDSRHVERGRIEPPR